MKKRAVSAFAAVVGVLSFASCGGNVGSAVRPADPNAAKTIGAESGPAKCSGVPEAGEPMVVDWRGTDRTNLEAAMGEGVAVVSYTCEGFKLLKGCKVKGTGKDTYQYAGVSLKEDVVQLRNKD